MPTESTSSIILPLQSHFAVLCFANVLHALALQFEWCTRLGQLLIVSVCLCVCFTAFAHFYSIKFINDVRDLRAQRWSNTFTTSTMQFVILSAWSFGWTDAVPSLLFTAISPHCCSLLFWSAFEQMNNLKKTKNGQPHQQQRTRQYNCT